MAQQITTQEMHLSLTQTPAHLWIGAQAALMTKAKKWLQKIWCSHNGCGNCISCQQVQQEQHHAIIWINPDKGYTLEHLEVIHTQLTFKLEADQHFYFVLQKADSLSVQCSNNILKSIEEPPAGYHFILLAERIDTILPTIRSRCLVEYLPGMQAMNQFDTFFQFLISTKRTNSIAFLKELDAIKINERDSLQLLDQLFDFWVIAYKAAITANNDAKRTECEHVLTVIKKALSLPPMPGSSKIFWKNLYLQIKP